MNPQCNLCAKPLASDLPEVRDPLTGEVFSILRCPQCGLGHTVPQPEDLGRYYARQYYGNRHSFTLRHCMQRRLGFVGRAGSKGSRLLDIGCGDGSFLLTAREAGWEVMGTELNPEPARKQGLDVKESVSQIEDKFDCITMWHTLEHMRSIPFMLESVRGLLKPGGKVIIAVPNYGGLQSRLFGPRWLHLDVPRHLYHFDRRSMQCALDRAGLVSERQWHQEFEYDLLGWSQSALNYILPRPNLFFNALTGKKTNARPAMHWTAMGLGLFLTALSLPFLVAGTLSGRGGTLITVARPRN